MSRAPKPSASPSGYDREVIPRRNGSRRIMPPAGMHGVTIASATHDFAVKLTELNDRSVRLSGTAVALQDPRDIAAHINALASRIFLGGATEDMVDAIGAQAIALKMAFARVETLRIDSGDAA